MGRFPVCHHLGVSPKVAAVLHGVVQLLCVPVAVCVRVKLVFNGAAEVRISVGKLLADTLHKLLGNGALIGDVARLIREYGWRRSVGDSGVLILATQRDHSVERIAALLVVYLLRPDSATLGRP